MQQPGRRGEGQEGQFAPGLRPRGGTCENFDRDARVIFLGLKFTKMSFFWVSLSWHHFFGVEKIAVIFLGSLKICIIFWDTELENYNLNQLMEVL